jgi:hypothetical protein
MSCYKVEVQLCEDCGKIGLNYKTTPSGQNFCDDCAESCCCDLCEESYYWCDCDGCYECGRLILKANGRKGSDLICVECKEA